MLPLKDLALELADKLEHALMTWTTNASTANWFHYVKQCLSTGGSKSFAYVARENNVFMNVTNHSLDALTQCAPDLH